MKEKKTASKISSFLDVQESKDSKERADAELKVPDPTPERAKGILEGADAPVKTERGDV